LVSASIIPLSSLKEIILIAAARGRVVGERKAPDDLLFGAFFFGKKLDWDKL